jgi:carbon storage regulator
MLVLSRKQSQRIKLGDSIVITVVRVAGDKVRLGIDAPRDMLVLRDELEPHGESESLEVEVAAGELASLARSA